MIARLGDMTEFSALHEALKKRMEAEVEKLARQTYRMPEEHDRLEWIRLRALHDGMEAVFATVDKARAAVRAAEREE